MNRSLVALGFLILTLSAGQALAADDPGLISDERRLTLAGKRSGEAYFDKDSRWLVFQSEREPENPFYQIYRMSLETGETYRVSPGIGKTTCAWFLNTEPRILFASTHLDPDAKTKMEEEYKLREEGKERRYQWDYDPHFDLFISDHEGGNVERLTSAVGYDAEGSLSPDDRYVVFTSNRHAYDRELSDEDQGRLDIDPSFFLDLYLLDRDTGAIERLTTETGYDGGPFFSPDGKLICWRHFSDDGATAEIWVMNLQTGERWQVTRMDVMSWAPYFHPSGEYLIFTTNLHGFSNFELYIADVEGKGDPVRATHREGFDGLPAFSPDGTKLVWTSNQVPEKKSQIFLGSWDHGAARKLLGFTGEIEPERQATVNKGASVDALKRHVKALAGKRMDGRHTGERGERLAGKYLETAYQRLELEPAGDEETYFQEFTFPSAVELGEGNELSGGTGTTWNLDTDWRPLPFSKSGEFAGEVVFAGYGIVLPEEEELSYDSYVHLDVEDKWVMVFRFAPQEVEKDQRLIFNRFSNPRFKAFLARERGAKGVIFVSGPESQAKRELFELDEFAPGKPDSLFLLSISDRMAEALLAGAGKNLGELHRTLDAGEMVQGFSVTDVNLNAAVNLHTAMGTGRNVVGLLTGDGPVKSVIAIGAHYDHLGRSSGGSSLARDNERGKIHYGADDNASGVAAMLEVAEHFKAVWPRDAQTGLLFCAWSGEELGLLGSDHFAENMDETVPVTAYLNMDMVGRLRDKLVVQGVGSSEDWPTLIEQANFKHGLPLTLSPQAYLPTDATSFYKEEVPILSFFTGAHEDYHTPRDTPDKLNYEGMKQTTDLIISILSALLDREEPVSYAEVEAPKSMGRGRLRVYLGTIPDYAQGEENGVLLSGVSKGGPADLAGVRGEDVIVSLAGAEVKNVYDYTYIIGSLKVGEEVEITVLRDGERITMQITPDSRD